MNVEVGVGIGGWGNRKSESRNFSRKESGLDADDEGGEGAGLGDDSWLGLCSEMSLSQWTRVARAIRISDGDRLACLRLDFATGVLARIGLELGEEAGEDDLEKDDDSRHSSSSTIMDRGSSNDVEGQGLVGRFRVRTWRLRNMSLDQTKIFYKSEGISLGDRKHTAGYG